MPAQGSLARQKGESIGVRRLCSGAAKMGIATREISERIVRREWIMVIIMCFGSSAVATSTK